MHDGGDQVALLVDGRVAWKSDDGTTRQVDLVHPASVWVDQPGIDIDGDERRVFKRRRVPKLSPPLVKRRGGVAFELTELRGGQLGLFKAFESLLPLMGQVRVG